MILYRFLQSALFLLVLLTQLNFPTLSESDKRLNLTDLNQLKILDKSKLRKITVTLDPIYNNGNSDYLGYPLIELISYFQADLDKDELVVICRDGYKIVRPLRELPISDGYLVVGDLTASKLDIKKIDDFSWRPIREGKETVFPAPALIAWTNVKTITLQKSLPWPHQIVEIYTERSGLAEEKLMPPLIKGNKGRSIREGFKIFKQSCQNCHSINKEGGALGPELNVPQNITTYRSREFLVNWIKNPQAYRWGSKMPGFPNLSNSEIDSIINYLKSMNSRKVDN